MNNDTEKRPTNIEKFFRLATLSQATFVLNEKFLLTTGALILF